MSFSGFFKKIGTFFTGDHTSEVLTNISSMVTLFLPIVTTIAAMTPNRTDDQILAVIAKYNVQVRDWSGLPQAQRGQVLLEVATKVATRQFPNIPLNQIMSAIQLAVSISKSS